MYKFVLWQVWGRIEKLGMKNHDVWRQYRQKSIQHQYKQTRRLGNVCSRIKPDPAHLHFSLNCVPYEEEKKHINILLIK